MSETGQLYLSEVFAKIVCSNNNQNIILLIEGKPGQGKSWAAMKIAIDSAMYVSKMNGGNPWDYFTTDNMGIIMPDDMLRVIQNIKKRNIIIFDDMGMAYSGRDWHSEGNKAMNAMIQTIRTDNNIIIITVPDSDWIDKIGRNILHFKVVMNEPLHSVGVGYSMGKVSVVEKMYNTTSRKNIYPFLKSVVHSLRTRYNHVAFPAPPKSVTDAYEKKRTKQLDRLKADSIKEYKKHIRKEETTDEPPKMKPKITVKDRVFELKRDVDAGVYDSLREACRQNGINYNTARHTISTHD